MNPNRMGDDGASTVPFRRPQPRPVEFWVCRYRVAGRIISAIARIWAPGDSGADGHCRLCDECTADRDGCLVVIPLNVGDDQAPLYSVAGSARQPWLE